MRRKGLLGLAVAAILLGGCGGDDDGGSAGDTGQEDAARQVVIDLIEAFQTGDFEAACELQDERVNEAIETVGKADTCADGYETVFEKQGGFGKGEAPFDEFIKSLDDYEVGDATLTEADGVVSGQVALDGPEEAASLVVEEDGEIKVSELFVTPDANTNPGAVGG